MLATRDLWFVFNPLNSQDLSVGPDLTFLTCSSWIIHGSYSVPQIEQHKMHDLCLSNVTCGSFATWQDAITASFLLLLAIVNYKVRCEPIMLEGHHSLLVIFGQFIYSLNPCRCCFRVLFPSVINCHNLVLFTQLPATSNQINCLYEEKQNVKNIHFCMSTHQVYRWCKQNEVISFHCKSRAAQ